MIRNLKTLGLVLGAVFAIGAIAAQAAFGVDTFTTATSPLGVTGTGGGTGNGVFKVTNASGGTLSTFHCQTNTFTGTMTNGASQVEVTPSYHGTEANPASEECDASLGNAKVDVNGCTYVLTGNTSGKDASGTDATVWIKCPTGKEIEFTGPLGCTIKIPAQTPTSGGIVIHILHLFPPRIKVTVTATGITFTSTSACGFVGIPAEGNTVDYNENIEVRGNGNVGIEYSES